MKPKVDYSLYLVTDSELMSSPTIEVSVQLALNGGATLVQLREKHSSTLAFYTEAQQVLQLTRAHGVPLIINDRVDIALALGADGIHVGQQDLPAAAVRRIIGPDMLLGVSASTVQQAMQAEADGADYLGVGAVFYTGTKTDADTVTLETLREITKAVSIPVVAIGGINHETLPLLYGSGIDGVAVVSAIVAQPDVTAATLQLKQMANTFAAEKTP